MKTVELLKLLQKQEISTIADELKLKENYRLSELLICISGSDSFTKEDLFFAVYKSAYTAEKDYLLRNEIRLLNKYIETYIVKREIEKHDKDLIHDIILLNYFIDTKQINLFEETWNAAYKKAIKEILLYPILELLSLKVKFISLFEEMNEKNYRIMYDMLKENILRIDNLSMDVQFRHLKLLNYTSRILSNLTQKSEEKPDFLVNYKSGLDNLLSSVQIKYYQAKQYETDMSFDEKINTYHKILALLSDNPVAQFPILNNLGVEYFVRSDFKAAYTYFYKNYELIKKHKIPLDNIVLSYFLNFISTAVSVGEYKVAIKVFYEFEEKLEKVHNFHNIQRIVAIAYLFLRDSKNAFRCMPDNLNEREKNEYYYYRAIYALGYILEKQYDMADREADNAYRALKATPFKDGEYEKLFLAIKHLINYKTGKHTKKDLILEHISKESKIGFHLISLINNILDS